MQRRLEEQVRRHQTVQSTPNEDLIGNTYVIFFLFIVGKRSVRLSYRNGYIPPPESFESVWISRLLKASPTHHNVARNTIPRTGISVSIFSWCGSYISIFCLEYSLSVQVVSRLEQLSFTAIIVRLFGCAYMTFGKTK